MRHNLEDFDVSKLKIGQAKCIRCNNVQLASAGWECKMCRGDTFTQKEYEGLMEALKCKVFVPFHGKKYALNERIKKRR